MVRYVLLYSTYNRQFNQIIEVFPIKILKYLKSQKLFNPRYIQQFLYMAFLNTDLTDFCN